MAAKLLDAAEVLGTIPDYEELRRLRKYYPTYEWEHRKALLYGYFQGRLIKQLVEDKLRVKGIEIQTCGPRSLGGHSRWVREKVKRAFVRILYLRYHLDDKVTQREANRQLLQQFDVGQSAIRKMTHTPVLDNKN